MKRLLTAGLLVLFLLPGFVTAQAGKPYILIEYVEGKNLVITTPDGIAIDLKENPGIADGSEKLYAGTIIETKANTKVELKLYPNKSIIKLSPKTTFQVKGIAGDAGNDTTAFSLVAGKVRMIAAKGSPDSKYEIRTQSTVCGVRGTDFLLSSETGIEEALFLKEGLVEFSKLADGIPVEPVMVKAGEFVDALKNFKPETFTQEQFAAAFTDMDFQKLKPFDVPGQPKAPVMPQEPAKDTAETPKQPAQPEPENPFLKWLKGVLGMEIGSITIDNTVYAKAVIQPNFAIGPMKLALYLPVIYSGNLFDPSDWYHPKGNDEWSFGFDYFSRDDYLGGAFDVVSDLALKIKSFEWGDPLKDEFALKLGNLDNFTIGHGLIMQDYANDSEFPAIRRVGFLTKLDFRTIGCELMVNDLAVPEIFGGRVFFRPIEGQSLAFGISGIADISPASDLESPSNFGDPIFIGLGADIEIPIVRGDALTIIPYLDIAGMMPYVRNAGTASIETGFRWDIMYDSSENWIKNYGISGGFLGNVAFFDYRLEFRYFTGMFKAAFFGKGYDRERTVTAVNYYNYLVNPETNSDPNTMGIYGAMGFRILEDKLKFNVGYLWPWSMEAGLNPAEQLKVGANDFLHVELVLKPGLIPVIDVSGSISYDKKELVNSVTDGSFSFFDENTVLKGEIVAPVPGAPNLNIAVIVATAPERDPITGDIIWADEAAGKPNIIPIISIETRFHL